MPPSEDCARSRPAFCFITVAGETYFMSSVYPLFIDLILSLFYQRRTQRFLSYDDRHFPEGRCHLKLPRHTELRCPQCGFRRRGGRGYLIRGGSVIFDTHVTRAELKVSS